MSLPRRIVDWCLNSEGSSRSSALIRISLAMIVWARWGYELLLFKNLEPIYFALSVCFFLFSGLMFIGWWSRSSAFLTGVTTLTMYFYFGQHLGREPWTHHHTYILAVGTFLCSLTPCGRSYSLDRWFAIHRAEKRGLPRPAEIGNLFGLRLIALQLSIMYAFTAYNKCNWPFLSGDRMEHYLLYYYLGSDYPRWPGFHAMMVSISWGTVLLEFALAFGLPFRRTRRWLVVPGLLLHASFYTLLPVLTYSVTMWALYLAYFDADRVHAAIDRISGKE